MEKVIKSNPQSKVLESGVVKLAIRVVLSDWVTYIVNNIHSMCLYVYTYTVIKVLQKPVWTFPKNIFRDIRRTCYTSQQEFFYSCTGCN